MIVASTLCLVVALAAFVTGLLTSGLEWIIVSMGASLLAGVTLFVGVRQGKAKGPAAPAPLGPPLEQIGEEHPAYDFTRPGSTLTDEDIAAIALGNQQQQASMLPEPEEDEERDLFDEPEAPVVEPAPPAIESSYLRERTAERSSAAEQSSAAAARAVKRAAPRSTAAKSAAKATSKPASRVSGAKAATGRTAAKPAARTAAAKSPTAKAAAAKSAAKPAAKAATAKAAAKKTTAAKPAAKKAAAKKSTAKKPAAKKSTR